MRWLIAGTVSFSSIAVFFTLYPPPKPTAWVVPAEADCRSEVIATIQRGATSGSYRYETQSVFSDGKRRRLSGIFVPPAVEHMIVNDDHLPGQVETISIDGRYWLKTPDGKWHSQPADEPYMYMATRDPDHIGGVRCLGEVIEDGRTYLAYEYQLLPRRPTGFPNESEYGPILKVLSDRMTALPIKFFTRSPLRPSDGFTVVETRSYEPGLKVEPPVSAKD
jgi:hypothetical protein